MEMLAIQRGRLYVVTIKEVASKTENVAAQRRKVDLTKRPEKLI